MLEKTIHLRSATRGDFTLMHAMHPSQERLSRFIPHNWIITVPKQTMLDFSTELVSMVWLIVGWVQFHYGLL